MARSGKIVRLVARFVAHVLIVAGLLMLVDAGLTVTWQEPVSAFIAARKQGSLQTELDKAPAFLAPLKVQLEKEPDPKKKVKKLAAAWGDHLKTGDPIGKIDFPTL